MKIPILRTLLTELVTPRFRIDRRQQREPRSRQVRLRLDASLLPVLGAMVRRVVVVNEYRGVEFPITQVIDDGDRCIETLDRRPGAIWHRKRNDRRQSNSLTSFEAPRMVSSASVRQGTSCPIDVSHLVDPAAPRLCTGRRSMTGRSALRSVQEALQVDPKGHAKQAEPRHPASINACARDQAALDVAKPDLRRGISTDRNAHSPLSEPLNSGTNG